ncbi:leucyl aminopeptidase [Spongorhabdus nitratireducens]
MEYTVKNGAPEKQKTQCLIAGLSAGELSGTAAALNEAAGGLLATLKKRKDLSDKSGDSVLLSYVPELTAERLMLVGTGDKAMSPKAFKAAMAGVAAKLKGAAIKDAMICLDDFDVEGVDVSWKARQIAEAVERTFYVFDQFKSGDKKDKPALTKVSLLLAGRKDANAAKQGLAEGEAIGSGVSVARTLGNLPGNVCTPKYLTEQAKELAKGNAKLSVKALGEKEMDKLGMYSFLSVSKGSVEEGQLIVMEYKGSKKKTDKPYMLLGKGITFDTGGISLKPGAGMDEMKFDMCGAASVMGAMTALVELDLPINVVALIAAAENMPAGNASKPGDIVTSMSGKTIEILNTDAEGRLVLCDALTYAEKNYKPKALVDIATLTGACILALGHHISGLVANDDELAGQLLEAGEGSIDPAWRLPMNEDYQKQLDTNFADMANIGGRPAGTITAGCFLSRFAEAYPWAHLDIAGTAWDSGKAKGASGRPVPLLVQYLMDRAAEA